MLVLDFFILYAIATAKVDSSMGIAVKCGNSGTVGVGSGELVGVGVEASGRVSLSTVYVKSTYLSF